MNSVPFFGELFIPITLWMAGKDSMKRHYRRKESFAANRQWKASQTATTNMLKPIPQPACTEQYPFACRCI